MTSSTEVSVIDVYQRHGSARPKRRSDILHEKSWLDRFCALLPAGAVVLDIGCGSGLPIACELIRRGFVITGVDAMPTMLEQFQRNLPICDTSRFGSGSKDCLHETASSISPPRISEAR